MQGYFIRKDKAVELGLLDSRNVADNLQRVIIALTDLDIKEKMEEDNLELSDNTIIEYANWFYKNYYDSLLESFVDHVKNGQVLGFL